MLDIIYDDVNMFEYTFGLHAIKASNPYREIYDDLFLMITRYSPRSVLNQMDPSDQYSVPLLLIMAREASGRKMFMKLFVLMCIRSRTTKFLFDRRLCIFEKLKEKSYDAEIVKYVKSILKELRNKNKSIKQKRNDLVNLFGIHSNLVHKDIKRVIYTELKSNVTINIKIARLKKLLKITF